MEKNLITSKSKGKFAVTCSVCVITYNQENLIRQALDSILNQKTDFDFEIVIGEDNSSDKTREICDQYQKTSGNKIKLIKNRENIGAIKNFEKTLSNCSGKYTAICEGDDYWKDSHKLQKQVEFLEKNREYGLVHSDFDILYEKNDRILNSYYKTNAIKIPIGTCFDSLLITNFICTATVCVRTHLALNAIYGLKDKYFNWSMGDRPIWLHISKHSKIGYLEESLSVRRVLEESVQHSKSTVKKYVFLKSSYDVAFFFAEKYGCSDKTTFLLQKKFHSMNLKFSFLLRDSMNAKKSYQSLVPLEDDHFQLRKNLYYYLGSKNSLFWIFFGLLLKIEAVLSKLFYRHRRLPTNEAFWLWD